MSQQSTVLLSIFSFAISSISLVLTLRLTATQRSEYKFFLREYQFKLGQVPQLPQKLISYNAALGGRAPKWHWIEPVVSPSDDTYN